MKIFDFHMEKEEKMNFPIMLKNLQIGLRDQDKTREILACTLLCHQIETEGIQSKDYYLNSEILIALLASSETTPKSIKIAEDYILGFHSIKHFEVDHIIQVLRMYKRS